ncbi:hypothetical protein [Clostridium sporogenes]|uniref:hypothetical protein n=1 Tax=Clostridium sporogenes TaxID=1509 RepID=UPI002237F262|nr:hypothetical protein [Clostridium sporogenes]
MNVTSPSEGTSCEPPLVTALKYDGVTPGPVMPWSPVGPVMPWSPVGPVMPWSPVGPVMPWSPVGPVTP